MHSASDSEFPDVDVIIPTYNCEDKLLSCLNSLAKQKYHGHLNLIIVDGGSTDSTLEVAKSFGATCYVNPDQYDAGLKGARRFGETHSGSTFVWLLDSDNELVEDTVLSDLISPLVADDTLNLSIPEMMTNPTIHPINNWLSLFELRGLRKLSSKGHAKGMWTYVDDVDFGITNATLIRRSALESGGGYDADVRLLGRLRKMGIAKGAIVHSAHFVHNQVASTGEFAKKWQKRMLRYSLMSENDLREYFVEYPTKGSDHQRMVSGIAYKVMLGPLISLKEFAKDGNPIWFWGFVYSITIGILIVRNISVVRKVVTTFI